MNPFNLVCRIRTLEVWLYMKSIKSNEKKKELTIKSARVTHYIPTKNSEKQPVKTQAEFNEKLINFFSNTLYPLSMVEEPDFKALVNFDVMSWPTLMKKLNNRAADLKDNIITEIKNIEFAAIATDV